MTIFDDDTLAVHLCQRCGNILKVSKQRSARRSRLEIQDVTAGLEADEGERKTKYNTREGKVQPWTK